MGRARVWIVLSGTVSLLGANLVATTSIASAQTHRAARCAPVATGRIGHFGGVQAARFPTSATSSCTLAARDSRSTPPAVDYEGSPPLLYGGGPVMGTGGTVTVTPIYWAPTGFAYPSTYRSLTERFVSDVAYDSSTRTNVFSTLPQYYDAHEHVRYDLTSGPAVSDSTPYPSSGGCTPDAGVTYSDGSGYAACLTDVQIQAELAAVLSANGLPSDLDHLYLVFLPKGVESCFDGANNEQGGTCTIAANGGAFCGYHYYFGSATIYADLPYAIEDNPVNGGTCSSDGARIQGGAHLANESPNANLDADTTISIVSHEVSEAITDPTLDAWSDGGGNEVGDDCSYIYGNTSSFGGAAGALYNQTINGDHYFIQEEFSNANFDGNPTYSCTQESLPQTVSFTSIAPRAPTVSGTYRITGSASSGLPVTMSTEEFSDGLCVLNGSASGSKVTFAADGVCTIDLDQVGTSTYAPAHQAHQVMFVGKVSSATSLRRSASRVTYGAEGVERLSVVVAPFYKGTPVTGSVTIGSPSATLCVIRLALGAGSCALAARAAPPGILTVTARYEGNVHLLISSSAPRSLTVVRDSSRTTLTLSSATVVYGHEQAARFSVAVLAHFAGTVSSGTVAIRSGGVTICTISLYGGRGSCLSSPKQLAAGTHLVSASFVGSPFLAPSASTQVRLNVT